MKITKKLLDKLERRIIDKDLESFSTKQVEVAFRNLKDSGWDVVHLPNLPRSNQNKHKTEWVHKIREYIRTVELQQINKKKYYEKYLEVCLLFFLSPKKYKGRPDIDNLIKFVLDLLEVEVYKNYKNILKLSAEKILIDRQYVNSPTTYAHLSQALFGIKLIRFKIEEEDTVSSD